MIRTLIKKGLNVARINFSHGDPEDHLRTIQTIRRMSAQLRMPVAILGDLCGPKIRVGRFTGDAGLFEGLQVFKANRPIVEHLKQIGALVAEEEIAHNVKGGPMLGTGLHSWWRLEPDKWWAKESAHFRHCVDKAEMAKWGKVIRDAGIKAD